MERMRPLLARAYGLIGLGTFAFILFFDRPPYEAWNWIPALAANAVLAALWPVYWVLLRWIA